MALFSISDRSEVDNLVNNCGYAAAALTILPIPGSEIIGVMPLHVGMVIGVAHHYGRTLTRDTATQLLLQIGGTVGLSLVGSRIAIFAAKFALPGLGGLVAAPFMFASTLAIGAVADAFFRNDGQLGDKEMKDIYDRVVGSAKSAFRPEKMRSKEAMDQATEAAAEAQPVVDENGAAPTPEEATVPPETTETRLRQAAELLEKGLITQDEHDAARQRILGML